MSKTECFQILNSQNAAAIEDEAEKAARPCRESLARRKLHDISNLPPKSRPLIQDEKSQSIPITTEEYIKQLQKEKMALVKMLAQRNKIVEQSGIELEKLRLNLIKVQEQNWQLAMSHTQMLAELNSGKDRLKALQHELVCKSGLLKARNLELKEKASTRRCQHANVNSIEQLKKDKSSKEGGDDEKPRKNLKRRLRSHSLGSSEPLQSEENAGNRPATKRRSARFKAVESKESDDLFEMDDVKFPNCPSPDKPFPENGSASVNALAGNEGSVCESQESQRFSLCRPSRMAAKKVQSYKEIPVNVKMRRSE